jgi:hypothetical protein
MSDAYMPTTSSETLDLVFGESRTRDFSATAVIGGKLRALYNEAEQPSLSRLEELLQVLDRAKRSGISADS